jgi:3-deoxy-D-manno-octulosonate 8-phosphate phosphatase (KDO 8-P phosphatase)
VDHLVNPTHNRIQLLKDKARPLKLLLTDCDGVLTDGSVFYGPEGEVLKRFFIRDGMGVERLRKLAGIETGIVTGELSESVKRRAEKLGIEELHLGVKLKLNKVNEIAQRKGLNLSEIAYIGDDVNDAEVLRAVGLSACPGDAMPEVKDICDIICHQPGGRGAFRELVEWIISERK